MVNLYSSGKFSQAVSTAIALCLLQSPSLLAQVLPSMQVEPAAIDEEAVLTPNPAFQQGYILGAGDQIAISVFSYEEFTGSYVVLPDGTISVPLIGTVSVAGQTPDSLNQDLTLRLQEYLVDPVVSVSLAQLRPILVTIAGEVERPGPVQLRSLSSVNTTANLSSTTTDFLEKSPTVSSALIQAGGITQNADIREIVVSRAISGGETVTTTINLWEVLVSGANFQDVVLQDGDSIYVPSLPEDSEIDRRLIADSTLAPATIPVRVVGEVLAPGQIQVPPDSTISSAIATAGGTTDDARLSQVALIRMDEAGQIDREIIDLRELVDEYQVQSGDVIVVPKQDLPAGLDFISEIVGPVTGVLNLIFGIERLFN